MPAAWRCRPSSARPARARHGQVLGLAEGHAAFGRRTLVVKIVGRRPFERAAPLGNLRNHGVPPWAVYLRGAAPVGRVGAGSGHPHFGGVAARPLRPRATCERIRRPGFGNASGGVPAGPNDLSKQRAQFGKCRLDRRGVEIGPPFKARAIWLRLTPMRPNSTPVGGRVGGALAPPRGREAAAGELSSSGKAKAARPPLEARGVQPA